MDTGWKRMIDDIAGFLEVAMALENVGVSVHPGAAPEIKDESVVITFPLSGDARVSRFPGSAFNLFLDSKKFTL